MARSVRNNNDEIGQLVEGANIVVVATRLGLQIDNRKREPRRAICPFHNDKDPSLNLYRGGSGKADRDHYHCFVCGAHGDAVSLIQNYEHLSFWEALQKLAEIEGATLSSTKRPGIDRTTGASQLIESLTAAHPNDPTFREFANQRGYSPDFLRHHGAANVSLQGLIEAARNNRVTEEQLVEAGIIRRDDTAAGTPDLYGGRLRGFFAGQRIVFPVEDVNRSIIGFAARALHDQKPKYLYSYDFPRRTALFGAGKLVQKLRHQREKSDRSAVELFLVEGIFDALRLDQLGFHAIGILGAQITPGQLDGLKRIIDLIVSDQRELSIHVFFDRDEAGHRGANDAIVQLLGILEDAAPFKISAIWPNTEQTGKVDPDEYLSGRTKEEAEKLLASAAVAPLQFLAAFRLATDPRDISWSAISRLRLASVARSIALALPNAAWDRILAPLKPDGGNDGLDELSDLVRSYAGRGVRVGPAPVARVRFRDTGDDRADLLTALTLGRSSTSRREYPLEDDSWERLAVAASPLFHIHRARLEIADGPSSPLLTRHLPKGDGRYRLKAGPVSHDALLQQYGLFELLRDRDNCPSFSKNIPAVRYSRESSLEKSVYRTGDGVERRSLSFAYQIDMAIVNGLAPPKREGIFRPYFECWRSFIDFLDDRIKSFRYDDLQILRLDITGFYDHVRRDVVGEALAKPLERALHSLTAADGDIRSFAPLFSPNVSNDAADRAEAFTNFILNHSFGLDFFDPITGEIKPTDHRQGIPQGPDLSAYLANISLFDLDDMMEAEVNLLNTSEASSERDKAKCVAAYARYVDDVVIICRDMEAASQLRRKVESHLAPKGLSLNRKNVTPPPMTRIEARAWITDNRAGFGFSGPIADLPSTEAMDPLADAGEIDRKTALGLIFDPELDNPLNVSESVEKIQTALSATEIRFNDRASAFRHLWGLAADSVSDQKGQSLATAFIELLLEVEPNFPFSMSKEEQLDTSLAWLEGLDRAIRSLVPLGVFEDEICERINANSRKLAAGVLDDVFSTLASELLGIEEARAFLSRYDVRCQIGIIACLAAQKLRNNDENFRFAALHGLLKTEDHRIAALPDGLRLSLLKYDASFSAPLASLVVDRTQTVSATFSRLNRTIVQLKRVADYGVAEEPVTYQPSPIPDENSVVGLAETILQIWSPNQGSERIQSVASEVELDAASALVNIASASFASIAGRRARLTQLIAGTPDAVALPSPPGLKACGILLWCNENHLLLATTDADGLVPVGVEWGENSYHAVEGLQLRKANLPVGHKPIVSFDRSWGPKEISSLYRAGFAPFVSQLNSHPEYVPVPTAFSFFGRLVDESVDFHSINLISWAAPRKSVDGHAFVRNGRALEARSVFAEGSDIWRYGWAVRDACNRVEVLTDHEGGLELHATTALDKEVHRREAMLARILPRLSGADRWGPGETSVEQPIPTRIGRALTLLEHFGNATSAAEAATYLVAAISEGIYMSERVNVSDDVTSPGQPAMLIARSAQRVSRALPEAAKHWETVRASSLPYRRSAAAWQQMSQRIAKSANELGTAANESLRTLEVGTEILAAIADLRALAFEITAALPSDTIDLLQEGSLDHSWISECVGLDLILVDSPASKADTSIETQVANVLNAFLQIVLGRRGGLNLLRDQITPAGWVTLVAILLQVVPLRQKDSGNRPHLRGIDLSKLAAADTTLRQLLQYLATDSMAVGTAENWPWDVFDQLKAQRPSDIPALLRELTEIASIRVTDEISWTNPRTGELQDDRPIMRLADGSSRSFAEWQIDVSHIRGERGTTTESRSTAGRMTFPYSVSRQGDQILGLHLVSRQLADAAFGHAGQFEDRGSVTDEIAAPTSSSDELVASPPENTSTDVPNAAGDQTDENDNQAIVEKNLAEIVSARRRSWKARTKAKNIGSLRVALVQWDVTDSYFSPGHKGGVYEGLVDAACTKQASATEVKKGGVFASTSEHRRRALIKELLETCNQFEVNGLIFPEYSLRPETINYLFRQLKQIGLKLTVWCGTFRVPSGTQLDFDWSSKSSAPFITASLPAEPTGVSRWDYHTAVLTCLRSSSDAAGFIQVERFARQKRYPSAAAGELIRPPVNQPWHPLLADEKDPFQLGTYTLELVCSEIFPHASSANFVGIIEENHELADRYGVSPSSEKPFKYVSKDIYEFAKWTAYRNVREVPGDAEKALLRGQAFQRTLIVLPAMTTRSADYHIFGQNQYLAAGLVTAFCNAVTPPFGCGQSGFIGLDGWKVTEGVQTPYGSKAPGIFQLGGEHSGALGSAECAMVIADLDLLRTADQRPRPHYQNRAIRLVAHLPIIFATEKGGHEGIGAYPNRKRQLRTRSLEGKTLTFIEATQYIAEALKLENEWRSVGNVAATGSPPPEKYTAAVGAITKALEILEEFCDDPTWLKKRTDSFRRERYDYPPMSPLPALVDWIFVDDRWLPATGTAMVTQDPLTSDQPILMVPRSMQEEPPLKGI